MRDKCHECGETDLSFLDKRFGHCKRKAPGVKVRRVGGYKSLLARFPGDPEANVGGDRDFKKLLDKRKRERDNRLSDVSTPSDDKTSKQILHEAYQRAKGRGFK